MKLDLFYILPGYMQNFFYEFPVRILFLFFFFYCFVYISLGDFLGTLYIKAITAIGCSFSLIF